MNLKFLDLFAGAGGLSEGFIQSGYDPIAHVEIDSGACFTLKTRLAFHWLTRNNKDHHYNDYLMGKISRNGLYAQVPESIINSVINEEIGEESLPKLFKAIDAKLIGQKLDLIVGGPPCQAYSLVGRSRDKNGMKGDKRNYLYKFYAEFLKKYQPKFFVFENVLGLLSAKDQDGEYYFNKMERAFHENGYKTEYKTLDTSDYSVPQSRKRVILIGKLNGEDGFYPEIKPCTKKTTVREILEDLPKLDAGDGTHGFQPLNEIDHNSFLVKSGIRKPHQNTVTWHVARPHTKQDLAIYSIATNIWLNQKKRLNYRDLPNELKTHNNQKSFLDRFKVVAPDEPSHTIVAHISKDGHYYIHPDESQNRSLSVREAARIQTFPDDYYFESHSGEPSRTAAFRQIGNAVPVLLAKKIAKEIKHQFN